jgi:chromate transport protein ChrA
VEAPIYALAFGVLTFAMRMGSLPVRSALAIAVAAVVYALLVAVTARLVNAVSYAPALWRAALILVAGTGLATFLFPLVPLAIVLGIAFCGLELARWWAPFRLAARDAA